MHLAASAGPPRAAFCHVSRISERRFVPEELGGFPTRYALVRRAINVGRLGIAGDASVTTQLPPRSLA